MLPQPQAAPNRCPPVLQTSSPYKQTFLSPKKPAPDITVLSPQPLQKSESPCQPPVASRPRQLPFTPSSPGQTAAPPTTMIIPGRKHGRRAFIIVTRFLSTHVSINLMLRRPGSSLSPSPSPPPPLALSSSWTPSLPHPLPLPLPCSLLLLTLSLRIAPCQKASSTCLWASVHRQVPSAQSLGPPEQTRG